jgi:hypothetical protein
MAKLSRPDPSDPLYAREARNRVRSAWRRFTFDEHLRNGCRVLIPLLEFRGGSGNSDSVVSGSLASPTSPRGGRREERGNEEDKTESRSHV